MLFYPSLCKLYIKSLKLQSVEWLWYHVEIIHLVLTNLPFEKGFYNMKLKTNVNKLCLYVIFLFGLISSTYLLFDTKQHYMINNIVYDQTKNLNITQDRDLSCNNLCLNGTSALDCSKPVLTIDQLQKWIGINWILFVICVESINGTMSSKLSCHLSYKITKYNVAISGVT